MSAELPAEFLCGICQTVLTDPVLHDLCGTNYCSECFNRYSKDHPQYRLSRCPYCRQPLIDSTHPNPTLALTISSTPHQCVCGLTLPCSEVNSHSDTCVAVTQARDALVSQTQKSIGVKVVNRSTFACPACSERNLDRATLIEHVSSTHGGVAGVCPVCAVMPWGDPNYVSSDLVGHMTLRHKFDYDTYTVTFTQDYAEQEEELLKKVLEDSLNQS